MNRRFVLFVGSVVLILGMVSNVHAAFVIGSISIVGGFVPEKGGVAEPLATATEIDFTSANVTGVAGDFSPDVSAGDVVAMTDFTFSPFPGAGVTPLWSVAGTFETWSFDLLTLSIDAQTANTLELSGTGTVKSTKAGLGDTFGTWILTGNTVSGLTFSWSSTTSAVPLPAAIWLFGAALLGMTAIGRRRVKGGAAAA